MYDMGRTAVASVNIAGREQQLICDLPGASTGVIDKLVAKNVAIDVHQPEPQFLKLVFVFFLYFSLSCRCCLLQ